MARQRAPSSASTASSTLGGRDQELGSMYDYLAKVILLGPSGCGKSCILHRFVKNEWRVFSSQTIGVEFSSKIVKVGTGSRRKRIKLQLWDTAGTERFRSVSRSYYRGAAAAVLVYDVASPASFRALPTFLTDARALASPHLTVILAGNKVDLADPNGAPPPPPQPPHQPIPHTPQTPSSLSSSITNNPFTNPSPTSTTSSSTIRAPPLGPGHLQTFTTLPPTTTSASTSASSDNPDDDGPTLVPPDHACRWASTQHIAHVTECSALTGAGVDDLFARLARLLLTRLELGEIDPDDPASGIQYGDLAGWGDGGGGGGARGMRAWAEERELDEEEDGRVRMRRGVGARKNKNKAGAVRLAAEEWGEVFGVGPRGGRGRRRSGCC